MPGPCCPQRGIWSLGEGRTTCGVPRFSPALGQFPSLQPGSLPGSMAAAKTQDPVYCPSAASKYSPGICQQVPASLEGKEIGATKAWNLSKVPRFRA